MSVIRSIVYGVVGPCKTESSQKPVPMNPTLADALMQWRKHCTYIKPEDWVFASKRYRGRRPYWGQAILRKYIRPVAQRVGIQKRFGWHTFRHTYSTLLRSVGTEFKVMQELLRHSSFRSTLDVYTQAVTPAKHAAQAAVISLVFSSDKDGAPLVARQETVGRRKGAQKGAKRALFAPRWFQLNLDNCFRKNGGDDETRTRDLCRDSNDIEEHGRHCKSLEVHHSHRYCVSRCVSRVKRSQLPFSKASRKQRWSGEIARQPP
jgi:Phage integrase family